MINSLTFYHLYLEFLRAAFWDHYYFQFTYMICKAWNKLHIGWPSFLTKSVMIGHYDHFAMPWYFSTYLQSHYILNISCSHLLSTAATISIIHLWITILWIVKITDCHSNKLMLCMKIVCSYVASYSNYCYS